MTSREAAADEYVMPTVDELLAAKAIGPSQVADFTAAAAVCFDGTRYGEFRPKSSTGSPHDWRFDKDSSERAMVAHAFAAAEIRNAQLFRREKPDFLCQIDDGPRFGLEVAEIHDPAHAAYENNVAAITLGVREALKTPERRTAARGIHCAVALGLPPTSGDARRICDELIKWFDATIATAPAGKVEFDVASYPVLGRHKPLASLVRGAGQSFVVSQPARSFHPLEIVPTALRIIESKRAKRYPIETPWLVLGLTDQWGEYRASLSSLWEMRHGIDLAPFSKIIVQYRGDVVVLGQDEFLKSVPTQRRGAR